MAYKRFIDEFIIYKGSSPYSGAFTPPTTERAMDVSGTSGYTVYTSASQNSRAEIEASNVIDISKGDFTIESNFYVESIYESIGSDPDLRYNIVGQFEDELAETLTKNWWALEYITHGDGTSEIRFRVWDESSGTYIADVYYPLTMDWEASYTNHQKFNTSADIMHIAVVRNGNAVRLFVEGDYVGTSAGTITDWDTITTPIQMNGQAGYVVEDAPYSKTYLTELAFYDYAKYWDEFLAPDTFTDLGGLRIYPRLFPVLFVGDPGDTVGSFSISPRFNASVFDAGDAGSAGYPHRMDVVAPEFHISITGLVEIFGVTSDGPLEKRLEFSATGYETYTGVLDITIQAGEVDWIGAINEIGILGLTLPSREIPSRGFDGIGIYNPTATISIELSKEIYLDGIVSEIGQISVKIPALKFTPETLVGVAGTMGLSIPIHKIYITSHSSESGTMGVSIPMLQAIFEFSPTAYINLVMNIRNYGLTEYSNYGFNSMCRFNNKHFGANGTAVYDLDSGKTDDGTFINWNFRSGYIDLEQKVKKKLKQAWMSYKSDGDLIVTVVLPDGTEYEYELDEIYVDETGLRVKFGKGISSKYVAIDIRNVDGADVVLDSMKIMMDKVGAAR